jgi:protein phosphatase
MSSLPVAVTAASHPGRVRKNNEDSFAFEPAGSQRAAERGVLCVVADGVGGQAAGEIASSTAVRVVVDHYYGRRGGDLSEALRTAVEDANAEVWRQARADAERTGMASTCTAAVVHQNTLTLAHVGDSRAYLIRNGAIYQVTTDHSQVALLVSAGVLTPEEARHHPNKNVILRALGREPNVEVDVITQPVQDGDVIVLCSDGLSGVVYDSDIAALAVGGSPDQAAARLIARANDNGAPDNVTVGLLQIGRPPVAGAGATVITTVTDPATTTVAAPLVVPAHRGPLRPVVSIALAVLAVTAVIALATMFIVMRAPAPEPQATSPAQVAPPASKPIPEPAAAPPTAVSAAAVAAAPPTSPPATAPPAPTAAPAAPTATPPAAAAKPTGQPIAAAKPTVPPNDESSGRPVILGPSAGGNPAQPSPEASAAPPLNPELAQALDETSVTDATREICRQARPNRAVTARVQERATVRLEPSPAAPAISFVPADAVVTILECVVGEPIEDTRIWLKVASNPPGAADPAYLIASVVARGEPPQTPGSTPGRPLGNEPTPVGAPPGAPVGAPDGAPAGAPAAAPLAPTPTLPTAGGQSFDGRPAPGQGAPQDQGSLNRP